MGQIGYFSLFPRIKYPYIGKMVDKNNPQVSFLETIDITVRYKFIDKILRDPLAAFPYTWKDGDRLDTIAHLYYRDEKYAWVVQLSARIYDWVYDLPLTTQELDEYLEDIYVGKLPGANNIYDLMNIVHHYVDGEGDVIDEYTYTNSPDPNKRIVSIYENEFNNNEAKREIKLLSREFLSDIVNEFEQEMVDIKKRRKKLAASG